MNTTLNEIKEYSPCSDGWKTLLKSLGKTQADDDPLSFKYILDSNGIEDAVWCLRVLDYKQVCLFCADVAELSLHIFENKYPDDKRPREAIEGIREFHAGEIDLKQLRKLRTSAAYAASEASAASAAYVAYVASAASADYADYAAYVAYVASAAQKDQWKKIEKLFISHFCESHNG